MTYVKILIVLAFPALVIWNMNLSTQSDTVEDTREISQGLTIAMEEPQKFYDNSDLKLKYSTWIMRKTLSKVTTVSPEDLKKFYREVKAQKAKIRKTVSYQKLEEVRYIHMFSELDVPEKNINLVLNAEAELLATIHLFKTEEGEVRLPKETLDQLYFEYQRYLDLKLHSARNDYIRFLRSKEMKAAIAKNKAQLVISPQRLHTAAIASR